MGKWKEWAFRGTLREAREIFKSKVGGLNE